MKRACVFVVLCLINYVSSANYYFTAQNGTNQAWLSTLNSLSPGDVVTFGAGTYTMTSRIGLTFQGTAGNPITIQGESGQQVIFNRGDANQNGWDISGSSYFIIQNLEFTGSSKGLRFTSSDHGTIQYNKVHDTAATAITCNDESSTYSNMIFRYNEVYNTGTETSECFYLGCNNNGCVFHSGTVEYNYCHDTSLAEAGYGSGVQIKTGSYSNVVRNNVFRNTKGPGVLIYDDYDLGVNVVTGNYIITTGDNGIQVTSGAQIYNNIVVDAAANGIRAQANQIMNGAQIRNIFIGYNTIVSRTSSSSALQIDASSGTGLVVANNAVWSNQGSALDVRATTATVFNNGYYGGSASGTGSVALSAVDSELVDPTSQNWYPKTGSSLIGAASTQGLPASVTNDFNCSPRTSPSTLGAYQYSTATNPNSWDLAQGFKVDFCSTTPVVSTAALPPASSTTSQVRTSATGQGSSSTSSQASSSSTSSKVTSTSTSEESSASSTSSAPAATSTTSSASATSSSLMFVMTCLFCLMF